MPAWWTAQDHRVLLRADHQLVLMCVSLLMLWIYVGFHYLGDCTFLFWSHLRYFCFTFTKDSPVIEEEVKILLLPPRTEVWSLVVVPAGKSPVT